MSNVVQWRLRTVKEIQGREHDYIYGVDEEILEREILRLLREGWRVFVYFQGVCQGERKEV